MKTELKFGNHICIISNNSTQNNNCSYEAEICAEITGFLGKEVLYLTVYLEMIWCKVLFRKNKLKNAI